MGIAFIKLKKLLSVLLLIFVLSSCFTGKSLLIEIPQKGKKELPENIQSLLLVSRVVDDSYSNPDADSLQRIFYKRTFDLDTIIKDIQTVDTTLKALGELLFESGRYDIVIPENRFLDFEKNAFIAKELSWDEVKSLCETYKTDAVLSIDYLKTRVKTTYDIETHFIPSENQFRKLAFANMEVAYESIIRVYDPEKEKVQARSILRDTLIWDDYASNATELFRYFTPVKSALSEAGVNIALGFAAEINPVWRRERRMFFASGDSNLKNTTPLVNTGQWETAISNWKETAENTKSKTIKSKAEFNIALGYEMLGDIDLAIEWALQSYNTMFRTATYNYLETLKRRKNELKNR